MSNAQARRRVAIVGCGYVGTALGRRLVHLSHDVVGTTTTPERLTELNACGIRGELLDLRVAGRASDMLHDRDCVFLTFARKHAT